jgi:hypothetical protein
MACREKAVGCQEQQVFCLTQNCGARNSTNVIMITLTPEAKNNTVVPILLTAPLHLRRKTSFPPTNVFRTFASEFASEFALLKLFDNVPWKTH